VFAGTEFTSVGLTNADAVNSVTLSSAGAVNTAGVGVYAVNAANAVGARLTNYAISYLAGTLTVTEPPLQPPGIVSPPAIVDRRFVVRFGGIPGVTYTIKWSDSPKGPWAKALDITAPVTDQGFGVGVFEFSELVSRGPTRFYRADATSPGIVSPPVIVGRSFVVRFGGTPGSTYTIEWSGGPNGPWTKALNITAPLTNQGFGVGVFEFSEPVSGVPARFYRAQVPSY
jgi:hypothetical protein